MRLAAIASAVKRPCVRAFRLPFGAPPPAPCILQTLDPRTAGARHWSPLRFDLAGHLDARRISKSMRLNSNFFGCPYPQDWGADVADDRLAALGDVNVLDSHLLLAAASVSLERLDLRRKGARELVEGRSGRCPAEWSRHAPGGARTSSSRCARPPFGRRA
jgi:hypothetical protein